MKLTMQAIIDGTVDLKKTSVNDIAEFVGVQGLGHLVSVPKTGTAKAVIMNNVVAAIEAMGVYTINKDHEDAHNVGTVPEEPPVVQQTKPEPKKKEAPVRANGEVIKLSRGGNDYGSNYLNRLGA